MKKINKIGENIIIMEFDLEKELEEYKTEDEAENKCLELIKNFLKENKDEDNSCFYRIYQKGHITGSSLVIDKDKNILLNHHKTLDKWLQFGGHSDGEKNTLNVAIREATEESGITDLEVLLDRKIFNVDVHIIPENPKKKEPEHYHYDIRFLLLAKNKEFKISDESKELKWVTIEEARKLCKDNNAFLRMIDKLEEIEIK